ncbi:hypothetical protein NE865_06918 [Phthorimaea operculella]|nr:hypothetical protein NE865_06918 [Phthorimaea operculella]
MTHAGITLNGHKRGIACLQYRDRLVVSGSSDNTIRLWDIECGQCIRVLEGHEELVRCISITLNGHKRGIACLQYRGRLVVSGSSDNTIRLWDIECGQCIRVLEGHEELIRQQADSVGRVRRQDQSVGPARCVRRADTTPGPVPAYFGGAHRPRVPASIRRVPNRVVIARRHHTSVGLPQLRRRFAPRAARAAPARQDARPRPGSIRLGSKHINLRLRRAARPRYNYASGSSEVTEQTENKMTERTRTSLHRVYECSVLHYIVFWTSFHFASVKCVVTLDKM